MDQNKNESLSTDVSRMLKFVIPILSIYMNDADVRKNEYFEVHSYYIYIPASEILLSLLSKD